MTTNAQDLRPPRVAPAGVAVAGPEAGPATKVAPAALTAVELERLLRALQPRVRTWLYRLLGPRADLDDACQEALIQLARALPRFEGRSSVETFARRVSVRAAYKFFKRRPELPYAELPSVPETVDSVDAEQRVSQRQELLRLHRCLQKLPDKRRVAFVLCAIEGLSPSEAAEVAGSSAVAMRSRLMHARRELERLLGGAK